MEFYSKSKPELVSNKTIDKLNKIFIEVHKRDEEWKLTLSNIWIDFIKPNLFAFIVFFVIIIYLSIRYLLKQQKDNEKFKSSIIEPEVNSQKKPKSYKFDIDEAVINDNISRNIINDNNISDDDDYDENSLYGISRDHQRSIEENDGSIPENVINEYYEKQRKKFLFDSFA